VNDEGFDRIVGQTNLGMNVSVEVFLPGLVFNNYLQKMFWGFL